MGVRLGDEGPGLLLDSVHVVGAGRESKRLLVLTGELDQGVGELGGVTSISEEGCEAPPGPASEHSAA